MGQISREPNTKVGSIAGQSLAIISTIKAKLQDANEGRASFSDLMVMIAIVEGRKDRRQVQADTGLDKVSACRALARLRELGIITPDREPKRGTHSPAPVYSLADPSMILELAAELELAQ